MPVNENIVIINIDLGTIGAQNIQAVIS